MEKYRVTNENSFYFGEIGTGQYVSGEVGIILDIPSLGPEETDLWFSLNEVEKVEKVEKVDNDEHLQNRT